MPTSIVSCGKRQRTSFRQTSRTDTGLFQEEIIPLIHQAIKLDEEEPISSEQLLEFAQVLEEEIGKTEPGH